MRPTKPLRQIGQIGGELRRNIILGIDRAHLIDILGAALLRYLQPAAQRGRQHGQRLRNDIGQYGGALAAAGHQHAENAVFEQRRIGLLADGQHLLAHRIANQLHLVLAAIGKPFDIRIAGGDGVHLARDEPVDAAKHGILFVDDRGDIVRKGTQ